MLLVACSKPEIIDRPVPIPVYVPEELRSCPGLPIVPGSDATQADVAVYIVRLHEVAKTCKVRLNSVDKILDDYESTKGVGFGKM